MSAYAGVFLCDVKDGETNFVLTNINLLRSRNIIRRAIIGVCTLCVCQTQFIRYHLFRFCLFLKSRSFDQKYVKTHESDHFTGTLCWHLLFFVENFWAIKLLFNLFDWRAWVATYTTTEWLSLFHLCTHDNEMKIDTDTMPKESTVSTRLQFSRIVLMADDFRCEMKIFIVIALRSLTKEYPMNLNLQWLNYANDRHWRDKV